MDFNKYEDAIFKNAFDCFNEAAPKFFGVNSKIINASNTELQSIDINKVYTDYIFYTEDGEYLHFEFQTTNKSSDLSRFLYYDALLHYKNDKKVKTIVVYSANITNVKTNLDVGSITYKIEPIYMKNYNGDKIYDKIKTKVENREKLSKEEIMELTFLPIMKNSIDVSERIIESITLAEKMQESKEKNQSIAMLYAFLEKFGDEKSKKKLKEVFSLTEIGRMIVEETMAKALKEGREKGLVEGKAEGKAEGLAEGKAEGVAEGKAEAIIKLLVKKFKKIPNEYREKIIKASPEVMDILITEILDMESIDDLKEYL